MTSDKTKGLAGAVAEALHPTLRRLGEIAIGRGLSQERLAKELRERFDLSKETNGANVHAHLTSKHPRRETIERYAAILGLSDEELYVIEHGRVSPDRESAWEDQLFHMLEVHKLNFEPGTATKIADALRNPATRQRVFAAMAAPKTDMFWSRCVKDLSDIPPVFWPVAEALCPDIALRTFLRKQTAFTNGLLSVYILAHDLYQNDEKAHAFVDACAAILRLDGFDTRPMYDVLRDWLEGSAAALLSSPIKRSHSPGFGPYLTDLSQTERTS